MSDFVLFSTADWFTRYWTNKQHTAAGLAARGHRVLYVETLGLRRPRLGDRRDLGRLWRRLVAGLGQLWSGPTEVRPGLWLMSPLALPFKQDWPAVRWLNQGLLRFALRRFLRRSGFATPEIWTYHPFMLAAIDGLPHGALSYHCVDDLAAIPGIDGDSFRRAEATLLARCDAVFVTSRTLEARCRRLNDNVAFITNVVDAVHFSAALVPGAEPPELAAIPHPRLGFHGVLSDFKVDIDLLAAIAAARPDWQLVLIGDERDNRSADAFDRLRGFASVHFLGGREYRDLPAYLRGFDVGLLPTLVNAYTSSMYPMKFFEYLAAGVPVVATELPFARDAGSSFLVGATPAEFIAAIAAQLARGRLSPDQARLAVGDNTWDRRLDRMLAITARAAP